MSTPSKRAASSAIDVSIVGTSGPRASLFVISRIALSRWPRRADSSKSRAFSSAIAACPAKSVSTARSSSVKGLFGVSS
ncbi:MAG: hypothetical protein DMD91_08835 [Candidatus Rokuibacteriota bacterium]|nr:MAG: hypothetical protein DMD91_08835 [Candidatus Rokubacteria bacterium]